ncbi:MAG: MucBP domain-containing protein [Levilactobacillus sp.]|uniref:MucBP domain-containing protein n=1 Tax=Levilactobacillus sp. TaxID=2767919 RepID=UPI00258D9C5E|nr:MucBP domain-containing protein [Levilactobacillus sp.]MCI1552948.1 MucBP domain-containing protein [Levilactobacillus sp.]MCI1598088.1 MucBP domain-containing protein [Levilactobacillus sp.]MCI1606078.1 MucBP domain-containing protein [Levilactobacillus sp.]
MFKGHNESLHYKMYKSGKSWVFAGIVSVGLLVGFGGVTASADTAPTTSDDPAGQVMAEKQPTPADGSVTDTSKADASLPGAANSDDVAPDDQQPDTTPTAADTTPDTVPDDPTSPAPTDDPQNQDPVDNDGHTAEPTAPVTPTRHPGRLAKMAAPTPQNPATPAPTTPAPVATPAAVPEAAPVTASDASIDTWMPNKTLQQMVANQLHKDVASLTKEDITSLTRLEATHVQYSPNVFVDGTSSFDLTGLELATNLTYLDLSFDPSVDYVGLSEGNRSHWGDVTSLDALSGLTNLQTLILANNRISDISPLANLKKLKTLDLKNNNILNFSMLDASQFSSLLINDQLVMTNDTQFIDPQHPTLTMPQPLKLPQNFVGKFTKTFEQDPSYDKLLELKNSTIHDNNRLTGNVLFLQSGTTMANYQLLDNGNIQFSDIFSQEPFGTVSENDWKDANDDYEINTLPAVAIIKQDHKFYLRADLSLRYTLASNSTKTQNAFFKIFIPYDNLQTAGDLTVKYLNIDGTPIQADQVITGKLTSDTYDLTAETTSLTGYTYDHVDGGDLTGAYTTEPQTISLYLTKDATKPVTPVTPPVVTPTTTVTVTTHYVDQNGQSLHADQIQTGQAGDHYTTAALALPNYTLTATPANASGTLGTADVVVTYVYHQLDDPDQPTTPAPTTDSSDDNATSDTGTTTGQQAAQVNPQVADVATLVSHAGQGATIADLTTTTGQPAQVTTTSTAPAGTTSPAPTQSTAKTTLPQTNDQTRSPLIGLALLVGTLIGFGLKRKQH